ncbi:hypothetical protein ALC57_09015 [Trachymyrmex cornetzi]|uniref:ABC transmembrane type-1 domain-containing protein n=1 Tax=Trachymyrmex cornetzi TaxID=471704 RepID=A0A151J625_9HYME|nr:hypothetical protein ALC57_09015 [Trachymyrmex cornetzi]
MAVMDILLRVLQPLLLGQMLLYFNTTDVDKSYAYGYAVGVILCSALNVFVIHPYTIGMLHMGMKIRVACCSLIYRKTLKLTKTALGETTIGQAVNLLSNDVNRFDISIIFLHYLWLGPLETIIMTYVMYDIIDVGVSSVIGVAFLLMFIPLQGWLGKKSSELRLKTAIRTDARVRLTNEIISGIQAIKMYTWENPFSALIQKARNAVDAQVGKHMFEECIDKYLRSKTRILVTHQLQYLRDVGRIIVLKDGAIQAEGTYDELGSMGVDFGRLLENQAKTDETSSRPASTTVSRSNSRTSISSLSTVMTNDTSKQEPLEVIRTNFVTLLLTRILFN